MSEVRSINVLGDVLMECSEDNDSLFSQVNKAKIALDLKVRELDGCFKTNDDNELKIMGLSKQLSSKINESRIFESQVDHYRIKLKSLQLVFGVSVVIAGGELLYIAFGKR